MSGSIKARPTGGELTPELVTSALTRARDDILESAARMVEARASLYRSHPRNPDVLLSAKAEEAEDIAAALRALQRGAARESLA
jgi:hypothetical protein